MLFKFRGFGYCRYRLSVQNHEQRTIDDFGCVLPQGHDGPHVGPKGQTWFNDKAFELDLEKRFVVPTEKKIFLPKK